ncbi:hypothetical protein [Novosphingobium sp. Leaf2]|uniref:hypothetical protein n=1 Tax=Novosphingobium sp. Leaf2 TaxID=1735670 RepID=UPI0006FD974B|nr:hypothetical protein [Novosphingobium sp. Leaf2]KQM21083.1 hypothetical protein ASE49_15495 [Novosphingobium sp. Leaf2]
MTDPTQRPTDKSAPTDEHVDEELNPGQNTQATGGAGANPNPTHLEIEKRMPLGRKDHVQAGTARDPKHLPEGTGQNQ